MYGVTVGPAVGAHFASIGKVGCDAYDEIEVAIAVLVSEAANRRAVRSSVATVTVVADVDPDHAVE